MRHARPPEFSAINTTSRCSGKRKSNAQDFVHQGKEVKDRYLFFPASFRLQQIVEDIASGPAEARKSGGPIAQ
jgi:hypothetical protein